VEFLRDYPGKDGHLLLKGATTFAVNAVLTISWQDCLENAVEPESLMSRQLQGEADGVTPPLVEALGAQQGFRRIYIDWSSGVVVMVKLAN
jgi:hypothetical protein